MGHCNLLVLFLRVVQQVYPFVPVVEQYDILVDGVDLNYPIPEMH